MREILQRLFVLTSWFVLVVGFKVGSAQAQQSLLGQFLFSWLDGIYTLDTTGQNLLFIAPDAQASETVWSPDGTKIGFVSYRDGNSEIYVMNADGSNQTRLTNNTAIDIQVKWSPDGTKLLFTSMRDGNAEIYTMNTNGTNQINLTNNSAQDEEPSWSPDATHLAFSSNRNGHSNIYTTNADGSNLQQVTNTNVSDRFPVWSPSSSKLAFVRYEGNCERIFTANADGSNQTQVSDPICDLDQIMWLSETSLLYLKNSTIYQLTPPNRIAQQLIILPTSGDYVLSFDYQPMSSRVTTNLLALYTFEEGGGTTVADVSGVGTAVNLVIGSPTNASAWGAGYLRFTGGAQGTNGAFAPAGTNKLHTALKAANAVTVEAWVTPANVTQQGPARVVTFSSSIWTRNFTIGQSQTQYDFRLRTTSTDTNGVPGTLTPANTAAVGLQHIVTTRDAAGTVTIYVNGVSVATSTRTGDFSGWDNAMRFGVGNELSLDRPWRGDVHLVAVYDRALSAAEVAQNFNAGSGDGQSSFAPENVVVMPDDSAREDVISAVPIANAGADISVTDSDGDGVETVKLDASASTDDGEIVEYLWGDATSDEPAAHGIEASLTLPVGTHEVLLIVVDADGQVGVDRVVVRVNVQ